MLSCFLHKDTRKCPFSFYSRANLGTYDVPNFIVQAEVGRDLLPRPIDNRSKSESSLQGHL